MAKPFALQPTERAPQLIRLIAYDVRTEIAIRASAVAFLAGLLGQVQDDCAGKHVVFPRQFDQRLACFGLYIGRVNDREAACLEALSGDVVQYVESVIRCRLIIFVVGDKSAAEIRREYLCRLEVLAGK